MSAAHLGIVELGDLCRSMADRDDRWFERLGGWVADEPDPAAQRLFADACHRHAWHADLWRRRTPTIPERTSVGMSAEAVPAGARVDDYRRALTTMRHDLTELRARIDPDLDPSTLRVITLVDADLADLAERLGETHP